MFPGIHCSCSVVCDPVASYSKMIFHPSGRLSMLICNSKQYFVYLCLPHTAHPCPFASLFDCCSVFFSFSLLLLHVRLLFPTLFLLLLLVLPFALSFAIAVASVLLFLTNYSIRDCCFLIMLRSSSVVELICWMCSLSAVAASAILCKC